MTLPRMRKRTLTFWLASLSGAVWIMSALQNEPAGASDAVEMPAPLVSEDPRREFEVEALREIIGSYRTSLTPEEKGSLPYLIVDLSRQYGYDPFFVAGLIDTESSFNNRAVSSVGARGLMQIMPFVGEALARDAGLPWRGVESLHQPELNVELGLFYLRRLEERFGNLDLALAAYNMGPTLLEEKMSRGFRPYGIYSGRVNAAYRGFLAQAESLQARETDFLEANL